MKKIKRWIISYLSCNVAVTLLSISILILSCVKNYGIYMILYSSNLILMCSANLIWLWINVAIIKHNHPHFDISNTTYKFFVSHFACKKCILEWILYIVSILLMYGTPGILAYLLSQQIHDSIFIPFLVMVIFGYVAEKVVLYRICYIYLNQYKEQYAI